MSSIKVTVTLQTGNRTNALTQRFVAMPIALQWLAELAEKHVVVRVNMVDESLIRKPRAARKPNPDAVSSPLSKALNTLLKDVKS